MHLAGCSEPQTVGEWAAQRAAQKGTQMADLMAYLKAVWWAVRTVARSETSMAAQMVAKKVVHWDAKSVNLKAPMRVVRMADQWAEMSVRTTGR